jgi:signal transduction histidine kinase
MPAELDALGLTVAVKQMVRDFEKYANIKVEMDIGVLDKIKNPTAQICLFRIFQEALNNIVKHSQAKRAIISATLNGDAPFIRIEDDGIGFNLKEKKSIKIDSKGMGLSTMALRCRMFGAKLYIDNKKAGGGLLSIRIYNPDLMEIV